MSYYDFIAANNTLEPLKTGIEERGYMLVIQNEERILSIFEDEPDDCVTRFTDLPVVMGIQVGRRISAVEDDMLAYIRAALKENDVLELWTTWNGEAQNLERIVRHENELTIEDIRWVFALTARTHPRGLKVYKWIRGKK